jgi:RIO kinase 1
MELIVDDQGDVAPRLADVTMTPTQALEDHGMMMRYVVRMLCAGLVHGDLSEFNVLVDEEGPVIIDLPQAVEVAANNNAHAMLLRDVRKITAYYGLFAQELLGTRYGEEIWALFEDGELHPEQELTGHCELDDADADVDAVMLEIRAALLEEQERQQRLQEVDED